MKISSLLVASVLSYGCVAKKIAVTNADSLINHQIQKKVNLSSKQSELMKKDVSAFLNGAKPQATELIGLIKGIDLEDPQRVAGVYADLEGFYKRLVDAFIANVISKHLAELDSNQQKALYETMAKDNKKYLAKTSEQRKEGFEKQFNYFFGKTEKKQEEVIDSYQPYLAERSKLRVERRVRLEAEFRRIYSEKDTLDGRAAKLLGAMRQFQASGHEGTRILEIIQKIFPTLSSEQKASFKKNAKELVELLEHFIKTKY